MGTLHLNLPERFNVATHLVDANVAAGRGGKVAVRCQGKSSTYHDILELTCRCANALRSLPVEMEERVLLLLLDGPAFIAAFFGAIRIGAVPIPTNTMLRPPDYLYMLNDSRARTLIVDHSLWPAIEAIRPTLRYLRHILLVGGRPEGTLLSFEESLAEASPHCPPADTTPDAAAFWVYSSGSTGFPKGSVHLHHDMVYCAEAFGRHILGIREEDVTFSASKLFFSYGLGNNLFYPFSVGAAAVLYPGRPLAEKMFEVIEAERPTIFYAVPTLYAAMLHLLEDREGVHGSAESLGPREIMRSVRLCISAGEPLPPAVYERWKVRFGLDILDGIGSTEMLQTFISNRPREIRPGSSGKPVAGYDARIVDDEGRDVPVGEVGNLLVKGDSAAAYYWNKHEKTKETFLGPWVKTGDKYSRDADGYYWYAGRSDDMLKVGGAWVSPIEVENALVAHPAVLEAAVVGAEDRDQLMKPKAFVVLKDGHAPSEAMAEALKAFVKERIAPYKYPRWIEFVEELPKTATGKIQRFKLRASPWRRDPSVES